MFINEDFLIKNEVGKILYHKYVKDLPIIDYHCHLDPKEIYEDIHFKDLSQAWLGGDGFVGGLLYGLLNEWEIEKCAQFAWASGALATSFDVDYATPIDEEQILNIWYGNARVSR